MTGTNFFHPLPLFVEAKSKRLVIMESVGVVGLGGTTKSCFYWQTLAWVVVYEGSWVPKLQLLEAVLSKFREPK